MTVAARVVVVLVLMVVIVVVLVAVGLEFSVVVDHRGKIPVSALAATVVVMVVLMVVVMVVLVLMAFALLVAVVMMMLVVVLERGFVDVVVESGTVNRVEHEVGELVFLNIKDGAHEVELHEIVALEDAVVLDTVVHVDEVKGDSLAVFDIHCGFDVAKQTTGFALDEFPDLEKDIGKLGLRIGVPVLDSPGETGGGTVGLLDRGLFVFVLAHSSINP